MTEGQALVFEGARLIIGNGTTIEDGAFVVEGSQLVQVGSSGQIQIPEGASRVDLTGETVMPALIDAHLHVGYEGYLAGWGGENYSRENVIDHLYRNAYYGIGAVFSTGTDPNEFAVRLQEDQRAGEFEGARFLFAAGMGPPGQGPNLSLLAELEEVDEAMGEEIVRGAATEEEGRQHVREVDEIGIRAVKLWVDDRGGTMDKFPPNVYQAIIDEAKSRGMLAVVHHREPEDMKGTAQAGTDGFLHGRFGPTYDEDEELIRLVRESGAVVIPNLGLTDLQGPRVCEDSFFRETVSEELVERLRREFPPPRDGYLPSPERQQEIGEGMTRFAAEGIPIVLGTDAGGVANHYFGFVAHKELEIYVRSGLTPMQAIIAGTRAAAEYLGLSDMGTLEAGKSADFIVLDANPLENISNTQRISKVFLRGQEVDREALRA